MGESGMAFWQRGAGCRKIWWRNQSTAASGAAPAISRVIAALGVS